MRPRNMFNTDNSGSLTLRKLDANTKIVSPALEVWDDAVMKYNFSGASGATFYQDGIGTTSTDALVLENTTAAPLTLIEVQVGDYLGEDDIIRYDDVYARR